MCEKTNELIKNILRLIGEKPCDANSLADLVASKYGESYYFSPNFTLQDILETENIFGNICYEGDRIQLTEKGQRCVQEV